LILPIGPGAPQVGLLARVTRSTLLETIGQDYIRTARAKGSGKGGGHRHALRNSLIPIISLMGLDLRQFSAAVVIEHIFARTGVGI
jgi:peptide/nickel transport system permease protein